MTWHAFVHALGVPGLRELPLAYAAILLLQGGYCVWVLRGFRDVEKLR